MLACAIISVPGIVVVACAIVSPLSLVSPPPKERNVALTCSGILDKSAVRDDNRHRYALRITSIV